MPTSVDERQTQMSEIITDPQIYNDFQMHVNDNIYQVLAIISEGYQ